MTTAQRFLSLSFLAAVAILFAPLVSAQGPFADLAEEDRTAIRAELDTCRKTHDDREARKTCADTVFEKYDVERPERHGRRGPRGVRQDIPEEAREALQNCREQHEGNKEDMKACAQPIFEEYDIDPPHHRGNGKKVGHAFRSKIQEQCGERENTEEWRACAKEARGTLKEQFQEQRPQAFARFQNRRNRFSDFREQLRACLENEDHDSLRACVREVRDAIREQSQDQ